jgi:type II secretory pathway pseudopilin PulG
MRGLGLIGLVVALAIVALVAKKQFAGVAAPVVSPGGDATVRDQARQVQDQYKQALDAAMQQSQRKMPDDE